MSMEEKIRINLSERTYQLLLKDIENFEFFKADNSLNKNDFFNQLIMNYYENYSSSLKLTLNNIQKQLEDLNISTLQKEELSYSLLQCMNKQNSTNKKKNDVYIAIRPTSATSGIIDFIENNELKGSSRSNYYRSMFDSYINLPQDQREQIIFKPLIQQINQAIQEKKKVYILSKKNKKLGRKGIIADPYQLALTKEELYNYLTMQLDEFKAPRSIRLCRIHSLQILNESVDFDPICLDILKKMSIHGPQFTYEKYETEPIVVQLSEKGKIQFEQFYLHRPIPTKIEEDIYTFECSQMQAFSYFSRFGIQAKILFPEKLAKDMMHFHLKAGYNYKNDTKENNHS